MSAQETPRQMVKALVRGEPIARPLLLPVVFSLGARLENLSLRDYLRNPTKISNALRQIRGAFGVDGLACYCDPSLEAEALGSKGEREDDSRPAQAGRNAESVEDLRRRVEMAGGILKMGLFPVAIEVLRRLRMMLRDDPALMVVVTGPYTLATQLEQGPPEKGGLEFSGEVVARAVEGYLEAGADIIFLEERDLPDAAGNHGWRSMLDPIINAIRFYEALPVLEFGDALGKQELGFLFRQNWACALCLDVTTVSAANWPGIAPWRGVRIPAAELAGADSPPTATLAAASGANFLSSRDVPAHAEMKLLTRNLATIRGHLISGA